MVARIDNKVFTIEWKASQLLIDGEAIQPDRIETGPGASHVLHKGKGYHIQLVSVEREARTVQLRVNGKLCRVELKSPLDLVLEKMGMHGGSAHRLNTIKAPMPGLIVSIAVKPGDTVATGDTVIVLEAMKMENVIRAAGDGVVKKIMAARGDRVEKGQALVEF